MQYEKFSTQIINEIHFLAIFLVNMWTAYPMACCAVGGTTENNISL